MEPVNERPIFPAPVRSDALGFSIWSTAMIRQLTQVFQQYGYRLNKSLLEEHLGAEGGTIPELDATQTWTGDNTFEGANEYTGTNEFTAMPTVGGDELFQTGSNANGIWVILFGTIQVCWQVRLSLPFSSTPACTATWTLPRAFANNTYFTGAFPTGTFASTHPNAFAQDATPSTEQIAEFAVGSHTTTNCIVQVQRQQGETNFVAGDTMYANVIAIGTPS